jgi:hypothetical protein
VVSVHCQVPATRRPSLYCWWARPGRPWRSTGSATVRDERAAGPAPDGPAGPARHRPGGAHRRIAPLLTGYEPGRNTSVD